MLKRIGPNYYGHEFWKLEIPEEAMQPGLEIGVVVNDKGVLIAGELIEWDVIDAARAAIS